MMTKKIMVLLMAVLLCVGLPMAVCAQEAVPHEFDVDFLYDEADLLTDAEEIALRTKLEQVSGQYNAQLSVVTLSSLEEGDVDELVEYLYDTVGFGYGENKDGVLLLVCMDPREFRILSNGFAGDAISLDTIEDITDAITSDLSAGDYAAAFDVYTDECAYYLDGHINGFPFETGKKLLIALAVGLVAAFIVTGALKGQLKTVRKQHQAAAYVRPGSLQITQSGDYFMYRTVTQKEKPKNNSSSSSGSSRNVGGGSF